MEEYPIYLSPDEYERIYFNSTEVETLKLSPQKGGNELSGEWTPYLYGFQLLKSETMSQGGENNGTNRQEETRRNLRERFVDRLVEQSHDGQLRCPCLLTQAQ